VLTCAEVAIATAELGLENTDLEGLHSVFEHYEIELIEEIDPATAPNQIIDRAPEKRTCRKAQLELEPGIGRVRLLTAQEEVDLARRVERGSFEAKQKMARRTCGSSSRSPTSVRQHRRSLELRDARLTQGTPRRICCWAWPTQTQRHRIPALRVDASAARRSRSPTRTR
jgi:hypothetical protein